ncbi:hypothetical protein BMS3Bbin14_00578 [bacterium BMS3Bbin14]|nr:hypothetical protein BMS3Abin13_00164 [bacterium BMS3Abin13]GBE52120.1 hypothetical protein BMS3Bbin14_00578 [bacterium BMS3Bbin14]HDK44433.1 hypothetical protein [Desulfobacteraceae bacterium]HDO30899.1 hypothetical protein [Desulfobacteraceae bacterium]
MEKMVAELKRLVNFKDTTVVGDLVLILSGEPQMLAYALVTSIEPDNSRKDEWWQVKMQLLSVPPRKMVWTLRPAQFTGREIFTMGGEQRFVQAVRFIHDQPVTPAAKESRADRKQTGKSPLRIIK